MAKEKTLTSIETIPDRLPAVKGVSPVGSQVIVEMLTQKELANTKIHLVAGKNVYGGAPQGYVVGLGPKVDPDHGLEVGQRVVLSGTFTPLPECVGRYGRELGSVDPHIIKAVLVEANK